MRDRLASLTARLVLTAVALVALASLCAGVATTLVMRSYLYAQLDQDVLASVARASDRGGGLPGGGPPGPLFDIGNQSPGTLVVLVPESGTTRGWVLGNGPDDNTALTASQLADVAGSDTEDSDGDVFAVQVEGHGDYRVTAVSTTSGLLVTGLPTHDADRTLHSLVVAEAGLGALAVLAAGGLGLVVVRRQLAPLREVAATAHAVAEMPLASGEIELTERVPERLTNERTEVGQVGAALNTLLDHVETALEARHRSEQQVRQFVADASHELRTPLATITGYTELARRRPGDSDSAELALRKVDQESARMTTLVEDLLLLARLDSGRPLAAEPVDLTRLLVEAVSDARVLAPGHHWRLDLPDRAVEVVGDAPRLHQVVVNLLTNARKYTPDGTTVTVSARPGRLSVHDDGPGFPPAVAERAFERFVRGDAARTRTVAGVDTGAGLGLALVSAIVKAHGGTVTLSSRPGDTTVTITLAEAAPAAGQQGQ